jgi:pyridoxal phosphate enzyme (YggS family)
VDSEKLLKEINKEAKKNNRVVDCLLEVYIAKEETKFGLNEEELEALIARISFMNSTNSFTNISIKGLMGMASFTEDKEVVRKEFRQLKFLFDKLQTTNPKLQTISMGMSADYKIAIEEGSNMVRIGSLLFGKRNPKGA